MTSLTENPLCNPSCRVCHYKHLRYSEQLERKNRWAREQLGRWSALKEIVSAPEEERLAYRSKSWMRSRYRDGEVSFGMFRAVQKDGKWEKEFVSWDTCPLHAEAIQRMIPKLKQAFGSLSREFLERSLVGIWMGTPHLVVISRDKNSSEIRKLPWSEILVPPFDRVWFHCNEQVGKKIFGHYEIDPIIETSSPLPSPSTPTSPSASTASEPPIRAFRQVAQSTLIQARKAAVDALIHSQPSMVLDLYCGTGDLSLLLPPKMGWVGIELSSEAVRYANQLRDPNLGTHSAFVGTVEHRLRDPRVFNGIKTPYALYLNPPRSGLTDEARDQLAALIAERRPTSIVYLSCSASSLARDLPSFERNGYEVQNLQTYDFFPQTEHFETLAVLGPKDGRLLE